MGTETLCSGSVSIFFGEDAFAAGAIVRIVGITKVGPLKTGRFAGYIWLDRDGFEWGVFWDADDADSAFCRLLCVGQCQFGYRGDEEISTAPGNNGELPAMVAEYILSGYLVFDFRGRVFDALQIFLGEFNGVGRVVGLVKTKACECSVFHDGVHGWAPFMMGLFRKTTLLGLSVFWIVKFHFFREGVLKPTPVEGTG